MTSEAHDRLVVQLELVCVDRLLQLGAELEPLDDALVHRGLEHPVAPLAVSLGHVHGHVGVAQELGGLGNRVLAVDHADTDARPREDLLAVDLVRDLQRVKDPRRGVGRLRRVADALQQDRELVAAEAGDGVGGANRDPEAPCDLLQDLVAGRVAEAGLEVVEVDEDDGDVREATLRPHQRVLDTVGEERAVREVGDRVVEGLVCELLLELLALAYVAAVQHDAADVLLREQVRVLHFEEELDAVATRQPALERMGLAAAGSVAGDQALEPRPVALAQQPVEPRSLDLVDFVPEDALD